MKPHPKIRKTIKWGSLVLAVLLVGTWVASGRWHLDWVKENPFMTVGLTEGSLRIAWEMNPNPLEGYDHDIFPDWSFGPYRDRVFHLQWWDWGGPSGSFDSWSLPLWLLAALAVAVAVLAWRLDILASRRERPYLCPKCGYDRTGLASGGPCPECGTVRKSV